MSKTDIFFLGCFIYGFIICPALEFFRFYNKENKELKEMKQINVLFETIKENNRILTRGEYRLVKSQDWYNQRKFLIMHLTETGFQMYNDSYSEGRNGKWDHYCRIFTLIQTPLFKAMEE